MKTLVFVTLAVALILLAEAEEDFRQILSNPKPFLEKLENQIKATDRNVATDKALAADLQNLAYAINQEIIAADSPSWLNPSPERMAVISKWAELLGPHTQKLVELAFSDGFATSEAAKQSRSVLDFAPATPVFAEQVRPFLNGSTWVAFAAAGLLYEHRLLTDSDREMLRNLKPILQNQKELERWANEISGLEMRDGLEVAKTGLASGLTGESPEDIITQFSNSLGVAYALGTDASVLLPGLETLIANPVIKSSGYLAHFESAYDIVSGKKSRQGRIAKNGSGPLSPWLVAEMQNQVEPTSPTVLQPAKLQKALKPNLTLPTSRETLRDKTPWSIIIFLIVAATGLLWLLLKRRS